MWNRSESAIPIQVRLLAVRTVLILATTLLILPPPFRPPVPAFGMALVGIFLASVIGLLFVPGRLLRNRNTQYSITVLDTFLVASALFIARPGQIGFHIAFFLVLFLTTLGRDLLRIAVGTTLVAGFFLFLTQRSGSPLPLSEALLQLPFLYVTGLYYGFSVVRVHRDQEQESRMKAEIGHLKTIHEITTATNSTLNPGAVLAEIVQRSARLLDAVRCSLILLEENGERPVVRASSDSPDFQPIVLDIDKYPELAECIRTRAPVAINNVSTDPMLAACRPALAATRFRSLLVVPLQIQGKMAGALMARSNRADREFTAHEIQSCQVIANASANAVRNALLFDRLREETRIRRETSEILQNILDHSPDLIFLTDHKGTLKFINASGCRLLGVKQEQRIGEPAASLFFGNEAPLTPDRLRDPQFVAANHQVLLKNSGGELRHGLLTLSMLHGENGQPNGIVGICKDLTEWKQGQRELQEAQKDSFVQTIQGQFNRINDPLAGVVGYAQLLLESRHDDRTERGMKRILDASMKCRTELNALLNIPQESVQTTGTHPVDQVLVRSLDQTEERLKSKRIRFRREIPDDLPSLQIDSKKLEQVFLHLIENAEQAIETTSRGGTITIRAARHKDQLTVEFEDDGPAIPFRKDNSVFEPVFSTRGEEKGAGLGLWTAYRIIRGHRGRIFSRPSPSGGAVFVVEFPLSRWKSLPIDTADAGPWRSTSRRILAVDDEQVVLDLLVDVFKLQGHAVDTARNGAEALRKAASSTYDAILLDLRLPDMHGTEVFRRLRDRNPEMAKRVIFNSVDTFQPDIREFISESGNRSIQKPFRLEDLHLAVASLTDPPAASRLCP